MRMIEGGRWAARLPDDGHSAKVSKALHLYAIQNFTAKAAGRDAFSFGGLRMHFCLSGAYSPYFSGVR